MKETIQNVLENAYFQFISIAVILLGVFADALANTLYYYSLGSVVALFILLAIWDVRRMQKIYQKDTLHIPVVINVAAKHNAGHIFNTLVKDIEKKHGLSSLEKNLKRYSNIFKDDLIFEYNGDIYNKKSLISFIQIISYQLNKIQANSANKVVFHLAYYKLPSIGFLVGAIFDLDSIVIYQNNPDKDSFDEVAITQERNYKNEVDEYKKFSITEPKNDGTKKKVLLGLKLSSHDIEFHKAKLSSFTNIVYMRANHKGTIQLDEDWVLYAREIFTMLKKLHAEYEEITIAHNMPESIAILVGMALGNYWAIEMTQYADEEYKSLIKLNEVKCYF